MATIQLSARKARSPSTLILRMEEDLLSGHFRPGEWLKQADIEERYEANRFDVRMALKDLSARRMLEHLPNRGYRVSSLSDKERSDLLETRAILERAAMMLAARNVTAQDLADLREVLDNFAANMLSGDLVYLRQLNAAFHDRLYAICGNAVLEEQIQALRHRAQNGFRGGWRTVESIGRSHEDHVQMFKLLEAGNGEELVRLVDRHLHLRDQTGAE
ncbi:GntR family transcriptional regulator [Sphingobium sp. YR768]|uniref:GntR family transcriptional regulator n=1 Tax=Sphingobium sp. YR768 TaxID=1884365 RepID=UPI0008B998A7|nr:GntR family transcriptional regulator [Sphingobium sp. YR768]SER26634.1 DNA-binding transcriptional regulator, GntR family [Sphingobium sp. YR768]